MSISLTSQEFKDKKDNFHEKFGQAFSDGFFYVEIPKSMKAGVEIAMKFASEIRDNQTLKTAQLGEWLGYQERLGSSNAAFRAMSHQWEQVYPKEVVQIAQEMNELAVSILRDALQYLSIPEEEWSEITGRLSDHEGSNVLTLNHYKPVKNQISFIPHRDMGWITLLYINKMGLQSTLDGTTWKDIPPKEGYFVVNFGRAFEILINSTDKLRASIHRVAALDEERSSFGIFVNHNVGTTIYQMDKTGTVQPLKTYDQYLQQCLDEFAELQQLTSV